MFSKGAAQNEAFVCQVLSAKAEKHVAGKWIGCLTLSTRSISEFAEILNEHSGVDVALLPRLRRSRRFQLGPSMWHADVVGELLRLAGWLGDWRRVCSKLGWFRPCLLREEEAIGDDGSILPRARLRREVAILRKKLRFTRQKCHRAEMHARGLALKLASQRVERQEANAIVKRGRADRYFSVRGGLMLAGRRAISRVSLSGLALVLGLDVSRTTAQRWELSLRASRVAAMRSFYKLGYAQLAEASFRSSDESEDSGKNAWTFSVHTMECDATNSSIWRKTHKLHVLHVTSAFVTHPVRRDSSMDEVLANTTVKSMMGDLQIVGGGSGHFSLGMMQKQLASVGCQSFGQVPLASLPEHEALLALQTAPTLETPTITMQNRVDPVPTPAITVPEAASAGPHVENRYVIHNSMTFFATTADSGSDEASARRLHLVMQRDSPAHLVLSADCMAHQAQLLYLCPEMRGLDLQRRAWHKRKVLGDTRENVAPLERHGIENICHVRQGVWCFCCPRLPSA